MSESQPEFLNKMDQKAFEKAYSEAGPEDKKVLDEIKQIYNEDVYSKKPKISRFAEKRLREAEATPAEQNTEISSDESLATPTGMKGTNALAVALKKAVENGTVSAAVAKKIETTKKKDKKNAEIIEQIYKKINKGETIIVRSKELGINIPVKINKNKIASVMGTDEQFKAIYSNGGVIFSESFNLSEVVDSVKKRLVASPESTIKKVATKYNESLVQKINEEYKKKEKEAEAKMVEMMKPFGGLKEFVMPNTKGDINVPVEIIGLSDDGKKYKVVPLNQTKYEYKLLSKEEVLKYINEKLAEGDVKTFKERKEEFLRMHSIHSEVEVRFKVGNDIIKVLSKIEKVYDGGDVEVSYTDKKTGTVQRKEFSAREILKWNKNKMAKAKISQGQQGKELKEKKQELKTEVESKLDQNSPEKEPEIKFESSSGSVASEDHPKENQDALLEISDKKVFGVIDGMGGHAGGAIASNMVKKLVEDAYKALPERATAEEVKKDLTEILKAANKKIIEDAKNNPDNLGMGTTAALVKIWEGGADKSRKAIIANVGDSRVYIMHADGKLEVITNDYNAVIGSEEEQEAKLVQEHLSSVKSDDDLEKLTTYEQISFDNRNVVEQALGHGNPEPRIYEINIKDGDRLIITSDGIHDNLTDNEIGDIMRSTKGGKESVDALIKNTQIRSHDGSIRSKPDDFSAIVLGFGSMASGIEKEDAESAESKMVEVANNLKERRQELVTANEQMENAEDREENTIKIAAFDRAIAAADREIERLREEQLVDKKPEVPQESKTPEELKMEEFEARATELKEKASLAKLKMVNATDAYNLNVNSSNRDKLYESENEYEKARDAYNDFMRSKPETMIGKSSEELAKEREGQEKTLTTEQLLERQKNKAERYGFKDPSFVKAVAKGLFIDTVGSIFGARLAWELPKLVGDVYKKKGANNATLELLNTIGQINENKIKAKNVEGMMTSEENGDLFREIENRPIREKIAEFNEKLKSIKRPETEKQELRDQLAKVLRENRHSTKKVDDLRVEKVADVFDVYANNSAQVMTVAKETVNTTSIMLMMPWLRGIGYTALAGVDSVMKASNVYDKMNFGQGKNYVPEKGRLSFIAKAVTVGSAKETYDGLIGNFYKTNEKGEKMSTRQAITGAIMKAVLLGGGLLRLAGVAEFEHALRAGNTVMTEGGDKIMSALHEGHIGEVLKQGGENWMMNAQRLLSRVGLSENPEAEYRKLMAMKGAPVATVTVPTPAVSESRPEELAKIKEIATIQKGEGVTHAFTRQIEHNPQAFGFKGNINDKIELHKFASNEAYKVAVENHYIDLDKGTEVRVLDAKVPSEFILNSNRTVTEVDPHTYVQNMREATVKSFDDANRVAHNTALFTDRQVNLENPSDELHRLAKEMPGTSHYTYTGETQEKLDSIRHQIAENNKVIGQLNRADLDSPSYANSEKLQEALDKAKALDAEKINLGQHLEALQKANAEAQISEQNLDFINKKIAENNETINKLSRAVDIEDRHNIVPGATVSHHYDKLLDKELDNAKALAEQRVKLEGQFAPSSGELPKNGDYMHTENMHIKAHDTIQHPEVIREFVSPHEKIISLNDRSKITFRFNDKNEIINVASNYNSGYEGYLGSKELLKTDWLGVLREHTKGTQDLSLAQSTVGLETRNIFFENKILKQLIDKGNGDGPEANFLRKHIVEVTKKIVDKYGPVFKNN